MQALLNDIELDVQELKCLIQSIATDENPVLRIVAKRNIHQMQERLDALTRLLDATFTVTPAERQAAPDAVPDAAAPAPATVAERVRPATDLRHAISLNDSFRFTRELFGGDTARMNEVLRRLGEASSLDEAMSVFTSAVQLDEENEAAADFVELLKKYFS